MLFNRRNRTADQEYPGMRQSRKHGVDKKRHLGRKRKKVDAVQAEIQNILLIMVIRLMRLMVQKKCADGRVNTREYPLKI